MSVVNTDTTDRFGDDLSPLQRDVLAALCAYPDGATGISIREEIQEYWGKFVYSSRFYSNMGELVEYDLVKKKVNDTDKRTKSYIITERGRAVAERHHDWQSQYHEHHEQNQDSNANGGDTR